MKTTRTIDVKLVHRDGQYANLKIAPNAKLSDETRLARQAALKAARAFKQPSE